MSDKVLNIPEMDTALFAQKGFNVIDIRGTEDQGITDEVLWQKVQKEKCLLITTDKGFSVYRDEPHHGILIIRLRQPTRLKIHQSVMRALKRNPESDWPGLMVVVRDKVQSTWKSHSKK